MNVAALGDADILMFAVVVVCVIATGAAFSLMGSQRLQFWVRENLNWGSRRKRRPYYSKARRPRSRFAQVARLLGNDAAAPRPDVSETPPDLSNPKDQMEAIVSISFERKPLVDREAVPLLRAVEMICREIDPGLRVHAQVCLGEAITPRRRGVLAEKVQWAADSIAGKSLDFAVFDRDGMIVAALEFEGSKQQPSRSFLRDAVKREAIRKAGVAFLEVERAYSVEELTRQLYDTLAPATS